MKAALAAAYPDVRPRAVSVWAGILLRFAFALQPGDLVVHPYRPDATVAIGRVTGGYAWLEAAPSPGSSSPGTSWNGVLAAA